ncbi:unnamed protein product [Brassica rapa]|uniref:DUF577 domain-containing protein n=1 Tax=Brassica campestris TaxID=3711 RepID=A0A3P6BIA5_BRACM|nr:unnamed protein product [Brassica rapa]VDD02598.1 unnamed protein product [Brassica rapa]
MAEEEEEEAAMEDPWIDALEESWNQMSKARDFLKTETCNEVAAVIDALFKSQESSEYKSARALYECCVAHFADFLTLKLLKAYRNCSTSSLLRFRMIYLLSQATTELRSRNFQFSPSALRDVKPLVISCLEMEETRESDIKILRRIVSFVAYNVGMLEEGGWEELNGCILGLTDTSPCRAFHVFLDVPAVCDDFITLPVIQRVYDEAELVLLNAERVGVQDWVLAFQTVVKIGVHAADSEMESTLMERIRKLADDAVKKGKGEFVDRGLQDLKTFLARDGTLSKYNKEQRSFVAELAFKIASCRHESKKERKKVKSEISSVLRKPNMYGHDDDDDDNDHIAGGFEIDWCNHLSTLSSPLEILRIFAVTDLEESSREVAIRRLNLLLSDHTTKKVVIEVSVMRQLQPLLISCLKEDRLSVSDSMFKLLGEVVFHVANEVLSNKEEDTWFDLWDYIVSQCKTQFEKAVYIFQSLTMMLDDMDILIPVIDVLLPEINTRLNPPVQLLLVEDNSCWVLAFVGAFCAAVHLVEVTSHADSVKEITLKMIDSVRELVERGGMEVGVVRRAFTDLEKVVNKQMKWYSKSDYGFVKGLLSRLYAIKAMKMESRMVLWRINAIVERGVHDDLKE